MHQSFGRSARVDSPPFDPNSRAADGERQCLHVAAAYGRLECVQWLLQLLQPGPGKAAAGSETAAEALQRASSQGWTALHLAGEPSRLGELPDTNSEWPP